jgi:general secretion pathway protein C
MKHWPLVASFVLFIALCASVAYWAMQLFRPPLRPVAAPPPSTQPAPNLDAAAGLFGGRSTLAVASNFQLKGVVVSGNSADSVAILATDGKPAQAVRANSEVAPGVTVKEVHRQYVLLSDGGVIKRVELPQEAKSENNAAVANRAPVPARQAPATSARPAPTAPPRVVVSPPPQQAQSGTPQNANTQPPTPAAAVPQAPTPTAPPQAPPAVPPQAGSPGNAGVPANTNVVPSAGMGGSSLGYNPAGSQSSAPPPQAPMPAAVPAPGATGGQPATAPQATPQPQPLPGSVAVPAQQR